MALNINSAKLKKCNVNGVKCKRINVNGVKVWTAETPLYTYGVQDVAWVGTGDGYGSGSVTFNDDYVELKSTGSYSNGARRQAMFTAEKIDLTDYDTIKVIVSGYDGYLRYTSADCFVLGVTDSIHAKVYENSVAKINLNPEAKTDEIREVIMDISSLSGEYYIGISLSAYKMYDKTDTARVYSVILE